jgi:hypothetical protein
LGFIVKKLSFFHEFLKDSNMNKNISIFYLYMFPKDIEEKIINLFVNAFLLGYRASFGALVYHTSIWFFSSISKLYFCEKGKWPNLLKVKI